MAGRQQHAQHEGLAAVHQHARAAGERAGDADLHWRALAEAAGEGVRDTYALQQVIRRTIGTWVNKAHRRRPMIIPVVIQG